MVAGFSFLKTDICSIYMSMHPHKMMASSHFNYAEFSRYLYVLKVTEFLIVISHFSKNLNRTTGNLIFIFIALREVWNSIQIKLF